MASTSTDSVIVFSSTMSPEIQGFIKDGFLLSVVILLFLFVLKTTYLSITLFRVMTTITDSKTRRKYPGALNLTCDVISSVVLIATAIAGIFAVMVSSMALPLSAVYLSVLIGSFINEFVSLIVICNSVNQNEYTLSFGLISMAIVITESLSLNVGSFFAYNSYQNWREENKDKDIQFWPFR